MSPFNLADLFSPRIWSSFVPSVSFGAKHLFKRPEDNPYILGKEKYKSFITS